MTLIGLWNLAVPVLYRLARWYRIITAVTINLEMPLDRGYLAAANRAHFGAKYWIMLCLCGIIALGSVASALLIKFTFTSIAVTFVAVYLALLPELAALLTLKRLRGRRTQHVTIAENGVQSITENSSSRHDWSAFSAARETSKFWLLTCGGGSLALPKVLLTTEQVQWLRVMLRQHGLLNDST